jgi:L-ribulokinase
MKYVIGLDYGTDSVRALVVNTANGEEVATHVFYYPRWKKGLYCDPTKAQYRQHPLDYLEGLETSIIQALKKAGKNVAQNVVGISVDTTGSTPVAVDKNGIPLSILPEFSENPNGMFILWKDHTAIREALEINELAHNWETDFTKYVGGIYSAEWFWAKILRTLRVDETIRDAAFSWVEHCDWISAALTSELILTETQNPKSEIFFDPLSMRRSRCAAGHKAMWHNDFEGLPSDEFLSKLDQLLSGLRNRLYRDTYTADKPMGKISKNWAKKLGLSENVVIGVGSFDAHMGAVGAHIEPYTFVRVMGTSTCDMLVAPNEEVGHLLIKGICGQVDGSILPNMLGMEAGQSAFGDVFAWFQKILTFPLKAFLTEKQVAQIEGQIMPKLAEQAALLPLNENNPIALDWFNGRRTPDANHTLKGMISGLDLSSDAPHIFKALVEATAFGSKAIVDRFNTEGVKIERVVAIGGVAKKSPFVMQTLANVLQMPIKVVKSEQACALGAAMCAATAAGVYPTIEAAQAAMSSGFDAEYLPNKETADVYQTLYDKYCAMGNFVENKRVLHGLKD